MTQIANAAAKVEHPTVEALRMFVRNPAANAGMVILLLVILVSIVGPLIYGADPFEIRAAPLTAPFTEEAWLGTDYLGRDVLTTLIYGGRATLLVGAVAALLSVAGPILSDCTRGRSLSISASAVFSPTGTATDTAMQRSPAEP